MAFFELSLLAYSFSSWAFLSSCSFCLCAPTPGMKRLKLALARLPASSMIASKDAFSAVELGRHAPIIAGQLLSNSARMQGFHIRNGIVYRRGLKNQPPDFGQVYVGVIALRVLCPLRRVAPGLNGGASSREAL